MKISYNWLKDYFHSDLTAEQIAAILTEIGLEVESLEKSESVKGGLAGLKIGLVKDVQKHPNADRLKLTKVNLGEDHDYQIVCGAPNVAAGQKVIVAPVGTKIFPTHGEPFIIQSKPVRGIASEGMICSEDEIGLGEDHNGIKVLPDDAPVGKFLTEYFPVETDWIFDVAITPNRGDAMSHIGIARDLFAYSKGNDIPAELKLPSVDSFQQGRDSSPIEVAVDDTVACPRFSGVFIENISVAESPEWLQKKLMAVGLRPINNVVDITNFVMLECGQPLHAYDAREIAGNKIVVKTLPGETPFITLDEKKIKLSAGDLMVCNAETGMCIAGVFGGINSGVKNSTQSIFLEAAYWNPKWIRRTSMRHNLRTDAAVRFEKGTDPNGTVHALKRAALLISELAGGTVSTAIADVYPVPVIPKEVVLKWEHLEVLSGVTISRENAIGILKSLEFKILSEDENQVRVSVPTFKPDVIRPADVIEEIARCDGYSKIPVHSRLHASLPSKSSADHLETIDHAVAGALCGAGFLEMMNNSITNSAYHLKFGEQPDQLIQLLSFSNAGLDSLRSSLLFPALEVVRFNHNRKRFDLKLFEFGRQYLAKKGMYEESKRLILILSGNKNEASWQQKAMDIDMYYVKGLVEMVLHRLGIGHFNFHPLENHFLKTGIGVVAGNRTLAVLGEVKNEITSYFDVKKPVWMAEFDWDQLQKQSQRVLKYAAPVKFPAIRRDLSMFVDEKILYDDLEREATKIGGSLLKEVKLFDIFEDEKSGKGKKSYAISFVFRDAQATLTDQTVDEMMQKLIQSYESKFHITIRS